MTPPHTHRHTNTHPRPPGPPPPRCWAQGWFTCPEGTIKGFLQLFDESKLVHASTIDFALFTLLTPFWMANDAEGRDWAPRSQLVPLLSFVPVVGPLIYLLLRPKGSGQSD